MGRLELGFSQPECSAVTTSLWDTLNANIEVIGTTFNLFTYLHEKRSNISPFPTTSVEDTFYVTFVLLKLLTSKMTVSRKPVRKAMLWCSCGRVGL